MALRNEKILTSNKKPVKKTILVKKAESKTNTKAQSKPVRTINLPEVVITAKRINKTDSNKKQNTTIKKSSNNTNSNKKQNTTIKKSSNNTNFSNSAISKSITPQKKAIAYSKGKKIIDPFEEILDAPQKSAMYLMGQGYKKPSEAMGIKNKYLATAADTVLDPTNALFFVKGSRLGKAAMEASKPKITHGINLTNPKSAKRIINSAKKYKGAAVSSDAQSVYNDLTKKQK